MPSETILLPLPREITWHEGVFRPNGPLRLAVDARAYDALEAACADVAARAALLGWELAPVAAAPLEGLPLSVWAGDVPARSVELPPSDQGYVLDVTPQGVRIAARATPGLFYGLQTLMQLLAHAPQHLRALTIRDWPALAVRGIHLDLKGAMAPLSYWQETLRLLSRAKINAVLVEYEDKFPFATHPELAGPGAFAPEELEALLRTARECFIEVIPLLQVLGHVEYVLRHPEHAHLRESGSLTQFCPSHEGSLPLVRELLEEMIAAHPDARQFHLGADEAWLLGDCPRCREAVEREGRLGLFLGFVNQAIDVVRQRGLRPIIWDDMIQRNLDDRGLELLPDDVVLCFWSYGQRETRSPLFYYGGEEGHVRYRWASREWLRRDPAVLGPHVRFIEEGPEEVQEFARKYWDRGEYPLFGSALPWVRFYGDHGRAVLGASAAKGADGFSAFTPIFANRYGNVATWAHIAREDGAQGVVSTAWSRYNGLTVPCEPFELGWHGYLASAALYWEANDSDRAAVDAQIAACFLEGEEGALQQGLEWLDRGQLARNPTLLSQAEQVFRSYAAGTPHGRRFVAHLALAARLVRAQLASEAALTAAYAEYGRAKAEILSAEHSRRIVASARSALAELEAWRQEATGVLAASLNRADVLEVIETQALGYERRLNVLLYEIESSVIFEGDAE